MFSLFVYFLRETKAPSSYQNNYGFQRRYTCLGKIERKNEWKYSLILRGGIYHCILPKWSCAQFTNVCIRNYLCCSTSYFIFGGRGGWGLGVVLFFLSPNLWLSQRIEVRKMLKIGLAWVYPVQDARGINLHQTDSSDCSEKKYDYAINTKKCNLFPRKI